MYIHKKTLEMCLASQRGVEHNWKSILAGKSGIKKIDNIDLKDIPVSIAGQVPWGEGEFDFNPDTVMPPKDQKKNDFAAIIERTEDEKVLIAPRKKEKKSEKPEQEKAKDKSKDKKEQEPEKEADFNIFRQIFKMAKKRKINKVKIGEDLSKEAKEKAAAAAAIEKMKVEGSKPKEINLKKTYIKELPPAEKKEIRKYNYSNMSEEERKEYKRKQKLLRKTGRVKTTKDKNIQPPQNSFINENSAELQATVTGRMMQQNTHDGGRE